MSWKTYVSNSDKAERAYNQNMARMIAAATKTDVTEQDFVAWAGDDAGATLRGARKVDTLALNVMGHELYREASLAARMLPVLEAKLKGKKTTTVGGIKFKL